MAEGQHHLRFGAAVAAVSLANGEKGPPSDKLMENRKEGEIRNFLPMPYSRKSQGTLGLVEMQDEICAPANGPLSGALGGGGISFASMSKISVSNLVLGGGGCWKEEDKGG